MEVGAELVSFYGQISMIGAISALAFLMGYGGRY